MIEFIIVAMVIMGLACCFYRKPLAKWIRKHKRTAIVLITTSSLLGASYMLIPSDPVAPSVTTNSPTDITSTSVTLSGSISNTGGEDCSVWFEYDDYNVTAEECGALIATGTAVKDGRSILWKNRHSGQTNQKPWFYQGDNYSFWGISNTAGQCRMGTNEKGLAMGNLDDYYSLKLLTNWTHTSDEASGSEDADLKVCLGNYSTVMDAVIYLRQHMWLNGLMLITSAEPGVGAIVSKDNDNHVNITWVNNTWAPVANCWYSEPSQRWDVAKARYIRDLVNDIIDNDNSRYGDGLICYEDVIQRFSKHSGSTLYGEPSSYEGEYVPTQINLNNSQSFMVAYNGNDSFDGALSTTWVGFGHTQLTCALPLGTAYIESAADFPSNFTSGSGIHPLTEVKEVYCFNGNGFYDRNRVYEVWNYTKAIENMSFAEYNNLMDTIMTCSDATEVNERMESYADNITATSLIAYVANSTTFSTNSSKQYPQGVGTFTQELTGLSPGTVYFYKAHANNTGFSVNGLEISFLTLPETPTSISNSSIIATSVNLSWTKGTGAHYTIIERNTSETWTIGEGNEIYNGTATYHIDITMYPDTTYYYQFWSYAGEEELSQYSSSYATHSVSSTIFNTTVRGNGIDYFVWMGGNISAYHIGENISGFDEASEYISIWNRSEFDKVDGLWDTYYGDEFADDYSDWDYYKTITIDKDYIDNDLKNFPMLINSTNTAMIAKCQANGEDIRFTSMNKKISFDYEIEEWTEGGFIIWVNISETITSDIDYQFLMHYGNAAVSDGQDAKNVWDDNYIGVWHMDDKEGDPSQIDDSTDINDEGVKNSTGHPIEVDCLIGSGQDFNGTGDYIHMEEDTTNGFDPDNDELTFSLWYKKDTLNNARFIDRDGVIRLTIGAAKPFIAIDTDDIAWYGVYLYGSALWDDTDWHLCHWVYNGSHLVIYTDGSYDDSIGGVTGDVDDFSEFILGASYERVAKYVDGYMDEVRYSNIARNASWIKAEFNSGNQTPGFITIGEEYGSNWWNTDWRQRKTITINSDMIDATLTNFPVLVSVTDSDLKAHAQLEGGDIIFIDNNDNQLNHEIESYSSTTGELIAWVNVISLSENDDTILHMYYGNPSCTDQQNIQDTWNSNFGGVWHMNQVLANDSTQQNLNATIAAGTPTISTGKIYNSVDFGTASGWPYDPRDKVIDLGTDADISLKNADKFTVSFWVLYDSNANSTTGRNQVTFAQTSAGCGYEVVMGTYDTDFEDVNMKFVTIDDDNTDNNGSSSRHNLGQQASQIIETEWEYWTFTYDAIADEKIMYRNGSLHLIDTVSIDNLRGNTIVATNIGDGCDWGDVGGQIDEMRISNDYTFNSSWASADYHTQNKTTGFIIYGDEQSCSYNFTVHTFDVVRVVLDDVDDVTIDMTVNSDIDYTAQRTITMVNGTNEGGNYTGYTNSTTVTLSDIATSGSLASGEYLTLWNETTFTWNFYLVGFWEPTIYVHQYDVIFTKVENTRTWTFGGV